ncbi:D-beta-hydroxybutyrate dehydrogenase, mitochondrial [Anabrus simplex]|uniref:D-beta-hydroxybutyrate dehydrogenase, mitochondrial n=1 Tax=Anabrus simplex TaxID=316456 RepID=UPI0035A3CB80
METTLDAVYRAAIWGLQAGVVATAAGCVAVVMDFITVTHVGILFLVVTLLGACVAAYFDTLQVPVEGKAVLVTGCDSGFGYDLALKLQKLGFVVFAGCLQLNKGGSGAKKLLKKELKNFHVIQLDVTSEEDVAKAVQYVGKNLPPGGLWGIVNNAGWSTFGHVEWVPISIYKKIMEVNVWGMIRVTQAFLPYIRKTKGRIVNVASGLGRQCALNRAPYCITKYGVEALSDCLRFEMKLWDIHVAIIEPGNFVNATGIFTPESIRKSGEELWSQIPAEVQKAYSKHYFNSLINDMIHYSTKGTTDKTPVLDSMAQALLHRFPHARYQPMELYFKVRTWVNTHLPEWIYEAIYV